MCNITSSIFVDLFFVYTILWNLKSAVASLAVFFFFFWSALQTLDGLFLFFLFFNFYFCYPSITQHSCIGFCKVEACSSIGLNCNFPWLWPDGKLSAKPSQRWQQEYLKKKKAYTVIYDFFSCPKHKYYYHWEFTAAFVESHFFLYRGSREFQK